MDAAAAARLRNTRTSYSEHGRVTNNEDTADARGFLNAALVGVTLAFNKVYSDIHGNGQDSGRSGFGPMQEKKH